MRFFSICAGASEVPSTSKQDTLWLLSFFSCGSMFIILASTLLCLLWVCLLHASIHSGSDLTLSTHLLNLLKFALPRSLGLSPIYCSFYFSLPRHASCAKPVGGSQSSGTRWSVGLVSSLLQTHISRSFSILFTVSGPLAIGSSSITTSCSKRGMALSAYT